ncbi:hypothetical protein [Brasilonema sp. UFV-L1]|uniref:hypothetical protein n=1 Tax=Brasilonema sp. UFV-L1 TaxID=2234130 RepID=UPI001B7CF884|nr:hypothetical protein [Brasilonema sp. UFV-L1]
MKIRLTRRPEELVFDETPTPNAFSLLMSSEITVPPQFTETITLPLEVIRNLSL